MARSCQTLCDPMDCSLPGSSIHGIFQARVLEWGAIAFSKGSSWPRDRIQVSCIAGKCFTIWATREATWVLEGSCQLVDDHLGCYQDAWKCTWTWGWEGSTVDRSILGSRIYLTDSTQPLSLLKASCWTDPLPRAGLTSGGQGGWHGLLLAFFLSVAFKSFCLLK